jgi:hypothetical protein
MADVLDLLIRNADPANAALVAVVWWRLDQRLREIRADVREAHGGFP